MPQNRLSERYIYARYMDDDDDEYQLFRLTKRSIRVYKLKLVHK